MTLKISRSQISTQPNPTHGWTQPMTNSDGCSATLIKWPRTGIYALGQLTTRASALTRERGHASSRTANRQWVTTDPREGFPWWSGTLRRQATGRWRRWRRRGRRGSARTRRPAETWQLLDRGSHPWTCRVDSRQRSPSMPCTGRTASTHDHIIVILVSFNKKINNKNSGIHQHHLRHF